MAESSNADSKKFTSTLINLLSMFEDSLTEEEVRKTAAQLAKTAKYSGDIEPAIKSAMEAIDVRMGIGVSLVDEKADHDERWIERLSDEDWFYSNTYEKHLRQEGWPEPVTHSLGQVSKKILSHLQDPKSAGSWDRRGLVIGHVQSGKTANYIGLVNRAADAGYKFVIVIAGIHNNLRSQTQARVEEGFVGRSGSKEAIGVARFGQYPHPATLTTVDADFNNNTAAQSNWSLNDFSRPIVLVIKKNVTTLKSLHGWLKRMNAKGGNKIQDVPMLMIDDEADNASINTNKPDLDPTKTNSLLRDILSLFNKSAYVGYTATPFANIFIHPESYSEEVLEDLFPRDFIYSLDSPTNYFGPGKVFLDEEEEGDYVVDIDDCEPLIPLKHKKHAEIHELPGSLLEAVNLFVLARTVRNLRRQKDLHTSMMVNVSRFVDVQTTVKNLLELRLKKLRESIKANYRLNAEKALRNRDIAGLKSAFDKHYSEIEERWPEIQAELYDAVDSIVVRRINSKSDEVLDYKVEEEQGNALNVIAVGGLSLSRGITIEGLCVSYMYRNTKMYDTLMQMGRWFGYRTGYEDLCKVYLSSDSQDWYAHIAEASEELRQQIRQMRKKKLSPREFGLYVKKHPDSLLVTAANKMRSGESVTLKYNFSGRLVESTRLHADGAAMERNAYLIDRLMDELSGSIEPTRKGWIARDVGTQRVEEFIAEFDIPATLRPKIEGSAKYLNQIADQYPLCDVLLISVKEKESDEYRLGYQDRESAYLRGSNWNFARDRVASRGDESLGLDQNQLSLAEQKADGKKPSDIHFRMARDKPLLMLHMMRLHDGEEKIIAPAFGLSFPDGDYKHDVEVIANPVMMDELKSFEEREMEEEDDYDD